MDRSLKALLKRAQAATNDGDDSEAVLSRLDERGRELILSTDSLTAKIESLYGSNLTVEPSKKAKAAASELTCDATLSKYLGVAEGSVVLEREVCLSIEGRRVLYARSLFSLACIERPVLEEILESGEPLGRVLLNKGVSLEKDMIEVAVIDDGEELRGCGLDIDLDLDTDHKAPLALRRYRLFSKAGSEININAALIEVFSRELIQVG